MNITAIIVFALIAAAMIPIVSSLIADSHDNYICPDSATAGTEVYNTAADLCIDSATLNASISNSTAYNAGIHGTNALMMGVLVIILIVGAIFTVYHAAQN